MELSVPSRAIIVLVNPIILSVMCVGPSDKGSEVADVLVPGKAQYASWHMHDIGSKGSFGNAWVAVNESRRLVQSM